MARNYPADFRLQCFYTENFDRESNARLQSYMARKRGGCIQPAGPRINNTLPTINPMQFARQKKMEEDERIREIIADARRHNMREEMHAPPHYVREKLYDGFTKEEKGRYQYLKDRKRTIPEQRYSFPVTSSMQYGWKVLEVAPHQRSQYALCKTTNEFFTRNGIPDMSAPTGSETIRRSKALVM